jgi:predicted secreted protein
MTLSATATLEVPMDVLAVTLSATREAPDAGTAQGQLSQALEAALAQARPLVRPGQLDVRTGGFSLAPRYAPPPARPSSSAPAIVGWIGRAELQLEGRDLAGVARLAGQLSTMSVSRVGFSLSRDARERAEAETSRQAIVAFRERAQAYAQQFGYAGYTIREVQVGLQEPPGFVQSRLPMVRAAGVPMMDAAIPVEAGQATVSSTVSGSVQMTR